MQGDSALTYQENFDRWSLTDATLAQNSIACTDEVNKIVNKDVLLQDFLDGFCVISKDHSLSRGYLDGLPALLQCLDTSTNVAKAANAAALGYAGMKHQRKDLLIEAERMYASLLQSFREAIAKIEESKCIATFMTTVLLGLYEIFTATDSSPGAQNIHLQGLSAILTAAGSPFDLLGGLRVFSMANALPVKLSTPHLTASLATLLELPTPTAVQNLDATLCKLNPILSQSENLLSTIFQDSEGLHTYFSQLSELEQEIDTWGARQINQWQTRTLIASAPGKCCRGMLALWPGHVGMYYDRKFTGAWHMAIKPPNIFANSS